MKRSSQGSLPSSHTLNKDVEDFVPPKPVH